MTVSIISSLSSLLSFFRSDSAFSASGYVYVFANNFSTVAKALLLKSYLQDLEFNSIELLYYTSALLTPTLAVMLLVMTDVSLVRRLSRGKCVFVYVLA